MDGPLSLSLSPSNGERVPKAGEGAVQGSKARTSIRGILSLRERAGVRGNRSFDQSWVPI